jgi:hypothetical protein
MLFAPEAGRTQPEFLSGRAAFVRVSDPYDIAGISRRW